MQAPAKVTVRNFALYVSKDRSATFGEERELLTHAQERILLHKFIRYKSHFAEGKQ